MRVRSEADLRLRSQIAKVLETRSENVGQEVLEKFEVGE